VKAGITPNCETRADVPVIKLSEASSGPGQRRGKLHQLLWRVVEQLLVTNSLQLSSRVRIAALRAFGAEIGANCIVRPRLRVRFPWNLTMGNDCWIGEGVWISNRSHVHIGNDVVISQESFLTTGSHDARRTMDVRSEPIHIEDGVWITSRCIVLMGTVLRKSCLLKPGTIAQGEVHANDIVGPAPAVRFGQRFPWKDGNEPADS
jgi:putative colanic acid biosynthesis acetyltransferase WcaF